MSSAEEKVRSLPCWKGPVKLAPLSGGLSNASFTAEDSTGKYVARVGEDYPFHQVSRRREAIASRAAFDEGLSPEVIYVSEGVMVVRHLEARTYAEADVRANAARCVDIVKRCHRGMGHRITGQGAIFWVFQIIRDYGETLRAGNHRLQSGIPAWIDTADRMERAQIPLPIVFGHHDLLPTNFMDDGRRLWLIDWEYGAFGTAMFDLANIASNNSFEPAEEQQMLERYFERKPGEALLRAFHAMKVASALREAMWGMVSELHLNAPGVDYVAYAAEYLERFDRVHAAYRRAFGDT
jgi:thiamine kinase-like enzyme